MSPIEGQRLYPIRQGGAINISGNFFDVGMIVSVPLPIKFIDQNNKIAYCLTVSLRNGSMFQHICDNPIDSIVEYRRVVMCWTGVDVEDEVKLNDLLGDGFFEEPIA